MSYATPLHPTEHSAALCGRIQILLRDSMQALLARLACLAVVFLCVMDAGCAMAQATATSSGETLPAAQAASVSADVKYVQANGIRFAYIEKGQGPLVLLMHGYPESARTWAKVQDQLAMAGYRVVAPYMRGYPPTETGSNYSLKTLSNDVLGLVAALGQGPAVVVGHDWGGGAAYAAASQDPGQISKLVVLSFPHPRAIADDLLTVFVEAPHFVYYQFPWAERQVAANNYAHIDRLYRDWSPGYQVPDDVINDVKGTLRVPGATTSALGYYRALLKDGPSAISAAGKTTISTPTLVIAGVQDRPARVNRFERARPAFTGPYQLLKMEGVGHFPQLEAPEQTAQAILNFLASPP